MRTNIVNRAVESEQPPAPPPDAAATVIRVRARGHLDEDGHRNPGDVFETTPARRAALGDSVEDVK